jgi:two-component system cell cycle response regulator DivK
MKPTRVLIVDDNLLNIELVSFLLEANAFEVEAVTSAAAAQKAIAAQAPDLILMDIQMPGMDGLALTRLLKAEPATAGIAIVAFTAYAMKGDEARMREAGCDGYIAKPIEVSRFVAQLRQSLQAVRALKSSGELPA